MSDFKLEDFLYKSNIIQPLKGFCNTVQEGSINKASQKMGLTQSTVTRQILALERELGIQLFDRSGKCAVPTEEGRKFYEMAIIQLQGMESLFRGFHKKLQEDKKNKLIIASHYTSLSFILPKYIKILMNNEDFKDLEIKLCNISKEEAFERLKEDKIDFAFYPAMESNHTPIEIKKERIFDFKTAIFINKKHPLAKIKTITRKDLEKYEYLLIDKYTFYDPKKIVNFKQSRITFEKGNSYIVLGLVKENIAVGGGSEIFLKKDTFISKDIIIKNVDNLFPKLSFSLFTLKNKKSKKSALFFFDKLRQDSDI